MSVFVQALASLQAVPSGAFGFVQIPVAGLQAPALWQASRAAQTTGVPGKHVPVALQTSLPLHALPSPHEVPTATGLCDTPVEGLQASTVHGF